MGAVDTIRWSRYRPHKEPVQTPEVIGLGKNMLQEGNVTIFVLENAASNEDCVISVPAAI
jgi:hypothetical protein